MDVPFCSWFVVVASADQDEPQEVEPLTVATHSSLDNEAAAVPNKIKSHTPIQRLESFIMLFITALDCNLFGYYALLDFCKVVVVVVLTNGLVATTVTMRVAPKKENQAQGSFRMKGSHPRETMGESVWRNLCSMRSTRGDEVSVFHLLFKSIHFFFGLFSSSTECGCFHPTLLIFKPAVPISKSLSVSKVLSISE